MRIELDQASFDNIQKQFDALKENGGKSAYRALMKVAFKIQTYARLRLTGRGHIVTSRLKNSIFVKSKKMNDVLNENNSLTYVDNTGKSYKSDLETVNLSENEFAVGTNVEYGPFIELGTRIYGGDSFLYWAMKNVDVMSDIVKDMQDDLKFGKFTSVTNTKSGKALTNAD